MSLPAPLEGQQMPSAPNSHVTQHTDQQQIQVQAKDTDVIEPVWAQRTEELIQRYAHDPYGLSQKLYELKSEYIYRRYGKNLKQATEHSDG